MFLVITTGPKIPIIEITQTWIKIAGNVFLTLHYFILVNHPGKFKG
jgi:hypothetical protein